MTNKITTRSHTLSYSGVFDERVGQITTQQSLSHCRVIQIVEFIAVGGERKELLSIYGEGRRIDTILN